MRFNKPLTHILDSKPKIISLRLLCNHPTEINGRQLAKIVGLSPTTVHKAMKELSEEQIIFLKHYGNSYRYELNKNNCVVREILKPMFNKEKMLLKNFINKIVSQINKSDVSHRILSVALFGSVSEGIEKPGSDLDLCVVVRESKDKKMAERLLFDINSETMPKIGMRIEPYIKTINEFKRGKELAVIKSILEFHQIIYGHHLERI